MSIVNPYARKKRPRQDDVIITTTSETIIRNPLQKNLQHDHHDGNTNNNSMIQTSRPHKSTTNTHNTTTPNQNHEKTPPKHDDVSALVISASNKAGMDGIDRTRIDAIILRESGDSLFMQQQRKRDERVNQRIQQMKQKLQQYHHHQQQGGGSGNSSGITTTTTTPTLLPSTNFEIEQQLASYRRPSRSTSVVVDMDMFYMACELLTRPELHDKPACVGRGMISTSNYCARKYGVRSAMPGFIGDKLVEELSEGKEQLIHVDHHFPLYKEKSKLVLDVLAEFDPYFLRSYSLDEAFLELGPYLTVVLQQPTWSHEQIRRFLVPNEPLEQQQEQQQQQQQPSSSESHGTKDMEKNEGASLYTSSENDTASGNHSNDQCRSQDATPPPSYYKDNFVEILETYPCSVCLETASRILADLRHRVRLRTGGLTCSAGLAPNFMVAKIASDQNKPNGQCIVDPAQLLDFVHPLPTRKIPGIGRVTAKLLQAFGISTVHDLYEFRGLVQFLFQPTTARSLLRASVGCDSSSSSSSNDNPNFENDDDEDPTSSSSKRESSSQKGMSRERTFSAESSWTQLNARLEDIARTLSNDMIQKQVLAHSITLKVKLQNFDVLSKCRSMARGVYVQAPEEIVPVATELLKQLKGEYVKKQKEAMKQQQEHQQESSKGMVPASSTGSHWNSFSCRLLGIRCSNLVPTDTTSTTMVSDGSGTGTGGCQLFMEQFLAKTDNDKTSNHTHSTAMVEKTVDESTRTSSTASLSSPYKKRKSPSFQLTEVARREPQHAENAVYAAATMMASPVEASLGSCGTIESSAGMEMVSFPTTAKTIHEESSVIDKKPPNIQNIATKVACPLCHQLISAQDNDTLNSHIDSCLNASMVRQAVREASLVPATRTSSSTTTTASQKKRRLVDFWKTT